MASKKPAAKKTASKPITKSPKLSKAEAKRLAEAKARAKAKSKLRAHREALARKLFSPEEIDYIASGYTRGRSLGEFVYHATIEAAETAKMAQERAPRYAGVVVLDDGELQALDDLQNWINIRKSELRTLGGLRTKGAQATLGKLAKLVQPKHEKSLAALARAVLRVERARAKMDATSLESYTVYQFNGAVGTFISDETKSEARKLFDELLVLRARKPKAQWAKKALELYGVLDLRTTLRVIHNEFSKAKKSAKTR